MNFTAPASWEKGGQDLAGANEIVLAYSERRQAIDSGAVSQLEVGVDGQSKTLWLAMQNWLEANCTSFVDHMNGPLNADATNFLYFTKATWQAVAGLNVSAGDGESFRRRINPEDSDSYGHIATGDCRGPWVFEDLQKGFGALKWTRRDPAFNTVEEAAGAWTYCAGGSNYIYDTMPEALIAAQATWPKYPDHSATGYPYTISGGDQSGGSPGLYSAFAWRVRRYFKVAASIPVAATDCELWVQGETQPYGSGEHIWETSGDPITTSFALALSSGPKAENVDADFGWFGGEEYPTYSGGTPVYGNIIVCGYKFVSASVLMKWDFENA